MAFWRFLEDEIVLKLARIPVFLCATFQGIAVFQQNFVQFKVRFFHRFDFASEFKQGFSVVVQKRPFWKRISFIVVAVRISAFSKINPIAGHLFFQKVVAFIVIFGILVW